MPQNHAQTLRDRQPMTRRLKYTLWSAAGLIVAAAVVAILLTSNNKVAPGCIQTNIASVMGAEGLKACGAEARQTCATVKGDKQYGTVGVLKVEAACRQAGLPVG